MPIFGIGAGAGAAAGGAAAGGGAMVGGIGIVGGIVVPGVIAGAVALGAGFVGTNIAVNTTQPTPTSINHMSTGGAGGGTPQVPYSN